MKYDSYYHLLDSYYGMHGHYPEKVYVSPNGMRELLSGLAQSYQNISPKRTGMHTRWHGRILGVDVLSDSRYPDSMFSVRGSIEIHGDTEIDFVHKGSLYECSLCVVILS